MQNDYNNTIREMILANESLRDRIISGWGINEEDNKIISTELFFLTFSLFPDYLKQIKISESWKEIFGKHDYIIQDNRIISGNVEIPFDLIEMTFIETLLKYREKKAPKIIQFNPSKKVTEKSETANVSMKNEKVELKFVPFKYTKSVEERDSLNDEAIRILNSYKLDKRGIASSYLADIKNSFTDMAYDSIVSLYNRLKKDRKDKNFKSNLPLLYENRKRDAYTYRFIYMLLCFYPIQLFAKDKNLINYSPLIMQGVDADANNYRFDPAMSEFEKQYEELETKIANCRIFLRNRKVPERDKRRNKFKIYQYEWQKRQLEQEFMCNMLEQTDMREIMGDGDFDESIYSSSLLNKHILYNIEIAMKNGHVRIDDDKIVFYSVVGDEVDFIINLYNYKIMDVFDIDNLLESVKNPNEKERVLSSY